MNRILKNEKNHCQLEPLSYNCVFAQWTAYTNKWKPPLTTLSVFLTIDVVVICLSLLPLNSFHQNIRNCISLKSRLKNYLFCVASSSTSLLLCLLSLLHSVTILHPLPSSRVVLTLDTYKKEGRRKVSSYFQFKLCAPEIWLIE